MKIKAIFGLGVGLLLSISILFFAGCSDNNTAESRQLTKSSTVLLKTGIKTNQIASSVLVNGGSLDLISVNINLAKIDIQENSGFDGEQQGENNDGDDNDYDNEAETPDITVNGPLQFDIVNGDVSIGNVSIYPGTFKQADLYFSQNSAAPFNGKSILVNGNFKKADGTVLPFEIKSNFNSMYEALIANGGIIIQTDQTVEIKISFDLVKLFGNLELNSALVSDNKILIDNLNNVSILSAFEANLSNSIDLEDNH